ncbi:alpha-2Db adrenergic receptor [Aphidius gifuensis]|uniref:alpha-2Db adrenergic receptor n=1 Tax=Aphidius gifuensis TaxID=684658 RepID=UPI001CDB9697|nr:alpha-2Db adrenergic receptor [Aphidius gifuensis]
MNAKKSVSKLLSTGFFDKNMSNLINWFPAININYLQFASSLSLSLLGLSTDTLITEKKALSLLSKPWSTALTRTHLIRPLSIYIFHIVNDIVKNVQETVNTIETYSTIACNGTTYHCSEGPVIDLMNHTPKNRGFIKVDLVFGSSDKITDNNDFDNNEDRNQKDLLIESSSISNNYKLYQRLRLIALLIGNISLLSSVNVERSFTIMEEKFANISLFNETIYNCSNDTNETYIIIGDSMYPSGYSLIQIIFASIFATILMITVIVGNMLVIIAIATEKALKNIQNWFIASLAVADFFLGLIIMPFSLANEIMGYWIFGYWWCDIYSAMDVLLCTASIMNLCLISLDRFWSITQAVDYLKKRTPARAALMIALVWLLSAAVCIPPLLGWKRPRQKEEYPKCKLSEDIGYVLYSALGSFYIPSCIMVFVYIRIYFAAKARARRGIRKQPRPRPVPLSESLDIRQTSFNQPNPTTETFGINIVENIATIENQPVQIPIVTCDFASDISTSEADGVNYVAEEKDTLKVDVPLVLQKSNIKATLSLNGGEDESNFNIVPARCRAPSLGIDIDMVSEFDPSSSDSGVVSRCAVVKPLKLRLCRPIFGRKAVEKIKRDPSNNVGIVGKCDISTPIEIKPVKPRDPEREKRRIARKKEKRATLILGLIMGSFIACWLPFFFLYIIKPLIPSLTIPAQAFVIAFWLGYINSALNPVIYTVFNKDFRRAFRRILYK